MKLAVRQYCFPEFKQGRSRGAPIAGGGQLISHVRCDQEVELRNDNGADELLADFDFAGFITKQTENGKWSKRFIILKEDCIYTFKLKPFTNTGLLLRDQIFSVIRISSNYSFVRLDTRNRRLVCVVGTIYRVHYMLADTKAETETWVKVIEKNISEYKEIMKKN